MLPSRRLGLSGLFALLLGISVITGPLVPAASARPIVPAQVAVSDPTEPVFASASGATRINVGGAVRSELTAASSLRTTESGRKTDNKTANLNVLNGLIRATAATSSQKTTNRLGGGIRITSEAEISNVNLFDGLIMVDAIKTTAYAQMDSAGNVSRGGFTNLVGVHIKDQKIPVDVPKNFAITIPGVAKVVLNEVKGQMGGDMLIKSVATGIHITLLAPKDDLSVGASIEVTPANAKILLPTPLDGIPAYGFAYSSRVRVHVGDAVNLLSAPLGLMVCPAGGTNGVDLTNSTARVRLPGLVDVQGLSNTANATVTDTETVETMTSRTGAVNLLNGAIKLDAIEAFSHVEKRGEDPTVNTAGSQILGLVINGNPVPVNVAPNTVIEIPGLVRVTINEQYEPPYTYDGILVRALHVEALPDAPDNIAGIDIELGVAAAWVLK